MCMTNFDFEIPLNDTEHADAQSYVFGALKGLESVKAFVPSLLLNFLSFEVIFPTATRALSISYYNNYVING